MYIYNGYHAYMYIERDTYIHIYIYIYYVLFCCCGVCMKWGWGGDQNLKCRVPAGMCFCFVFLTPTLRTTLSVFLWSRSLSPFCLAVNISDTSLRPQHSHNKRIMNVDITPAARATETAHEQHTYGTAMMPRQTYTPTTACIKCPSP